MSSRRPPSGFGAPGASSAARATALPRPATGFRVSPLALVLVAVALVGAAGFLVLDALSRKPPELTPRHRAEALCFALSLPPPFVPPMSVQPSSALVRGRFGTMTPAGFALQELMHFTDAMVIKRQVERVGDYDVDVFWLSLPGPANEHWLVLAWMEGADLAVCNFRFTGKSHVLSAEERAWGLRLTRRILVPEYFRVGTIPDVRLRAPEGATMPAFGPATG